MNLVEEVARMIDTEGAYARGYTDTSSTLPMDYTVRQKYFQAQYEARAVELLKFIGTRTREAIKKDLIEFEMQGWKNLGVPIEKLPEAESIIAAKY